MQPTLPTDVWTTAQQQGGWWSEVSPPRMRTVGCSARGGPMGARSRSSMARPRSTRFISCRTLRRLSGWIAGAPAVAAGIAGRALDGDVEQLGGDQSANSRRAWESLRAIWWRSASSSRTDSGARAVVAGNRAGCDRDAGRTRSRNVYALCERTRRKPDPHSGSDDGTGNGSAGVGGHTRSNCQRGVARVD